MKTARFIKAFTFSMNETVWAKLKKISDDERVSIAEVIRNIIDQYLKKEGRQS